MHGSQSGFMPGMLRWLWVGGSNPKMHYREVRDWAFHSHMFLVPDGFPGSIDEANIFFKALEGIMY